MDAIYRKEWLMMYRVNRLQESTAHVLFTGMHFFLFMAIFILLHENFIFIFWSMNIFGILHLALHIAFVKHRNNEMNNIFSLGIIILMAVISAISTALYLFSYRNI
jgi:NADH:ubiquinone oxidoreductase subunit K